MSKYPDDPRSNRVDIEVVLHHQTDSAVLVSDSGEGDDAVWLPRSQIDFWESERIVAGQKTVITMPEWLAIDKGLA